MSKMADYEIHYLGKELPAEYQGMVLIPREIAIDVIPGRLLQRIDLAPPQGMYDIDMLNKYMEGFAAQLRKVVTVLYCNPGKIEDELVIFGNLRTIGDFPIADLKATGLLNPRALKEVNKYEEGGLIKKVVISTMYLDARFAREGLPKVNLADLEAARRQETPSGKIKFIHSKFKPPIIRR